MQFAQTVAWGLCITLGLAVLNGIWMESEEFYTVLGIGFFIFGIWGAKILFKIKE